MARPLVGVTTDITAGDYTLARRYVHALREAGADVLILPPAIEADCDMDRLDGVVFSGGDDPRMEEFGIPTHPHAKTMDPERQSGELLRLRILHARPEIPVLGICLGMQLMALDRGGTLTQHLPDVLATAERHAKNNVHPVVGDLGQGEVTSSHHQAVKDAGDLRVIARSDDGIIEAVEDPARDYYRGVQWHPERTRDARFGADILRDFVAHAARRARTSA